jgi:hypothetical protein
MTTNNHPEFLADQLGDKDAEIKKLEAEKQAIREQLLPYMGDVPVVGQRWTVSKTEATSRRLDNDLVRLALGDRIGQFERPVTTTTLRVKQTKVLGRTAEGV